MAGTVSQSKKSREKCILRPSEDGKWEVWAMGEGDKTRLLETCDKPAGAQVSQQSVIALPSRQLFAVPMWLATADPTLMRDMVFLQLERRGVSGGRSAQEFVFDYRTVATEENKTLALAVAIPNSLPEDLCVDLRRFEPSPRTVALPRDEFILWHEDGRLVLAATRGEELAYFQALGDSQLSDAVLQELQCIKLQLEAANVVTALVGVTLWGQFSPGDAARAGQALDLRPKNDQRPPPVLPPGVLDLIPAPVRVTQLGIKRKERKNMMVAIGAAVYCVFLLILVVRVTWLYVQCRLIENELQANRSTVAEIVSASHRWDALDPAINPESYPVEQLLRCALVLPADGVRFTLFKSTGGKVFIQGEAKSAPAAFKFAEDLKQSPDLRDYNWTMPQPRILPNDNAEFQVQGLKYGTKAD